MYLCGVDVGTTGTKAMLTDEGGALVAHAYREYPLLTAPDGGVEQRAEDWWRTLRDTVREVTRNLPDRAAVRAVCLSTQGGSAVLCDAQGEALMNAHTWMDNRPAALAALVEERELEAVYRKSGWRLNGAMLLLRARWLQQNLPEVWNRADKYLTTVDYLNHRLAGRFVIDQTNAGMNQLMDLQRMDWDDGLLELAGVSRGMLPEIVPSGEVIGPLTPAAAQELGLSPDTLVVSGGHDQYCAAVGAGAHDEGDMLLSTGTAWVLLAVTGAPAFDTQDHLAVGNHVLPGRYGLLSSLPTGGVCLEWFRSRFAPVELQDGEIVRESFRRIDEGAGARILENDGLYFYPHFTGRTFPRWTPDTRASWLGVTLDTGPHDLALAVMEGVAFDMAVNLQAYAAKGYAPSALKLLGGASKSALWTSILSHVTGLPIVRFTVSDVACLGAAAMAGAACGVYPSLAEGVARVTAGKHELLPPPDGALRDHYAAKLARYQAMLPGLEALYATQSPSA